MLFRPPEEVGAECLGDGDARLARGARRHRERRDALLEQREAAARGGQIILITEERAASEFNFADAIISVPNVDPLLAPILLAVPAQILAYLTAVEKGTDVDQPRNLAKSVTVE